MSPGHGRGSRIHPRHRGAGSIEISTKEWSAFSHQNPHEVRAEYSVATGIFGGMGVPYQLQGIYAKRPAQGRTYSSSSTGLMT